MSDKTVFHFDDTPLPALSRVGGKGYSLMKMAQAGLSVPPGLVLAVEFFEPWIGELKSTSLWRAFQGCNSDVMPQRAKELQDASTSLELTHMQQDLLEEGLERYPLFSLFAVRSSSPEEDLEGASFAGGYETILGVSRQTMAGAVLRAFSSCLDPRVFVYKRAQGFSVDDFRIAVVVQAQVASEVAGVGFSVNPLNNDYDEAVFNASWGLGESVVSGLVSPDQITVEKTSGAVIDYQVGGKETAIWLGPQGGTTQRSDQRHEERSLDAKQITALLDELIKVEDLYDKPMDIEWAFSENRLYLLQARPITTCIPLPEEMVSRPNEKRSLYLDITLVIQALTEPLSMMGTQLLQNLFEHIADTVFNAPEMVDIRHGFVGFQSGRIFFNLSNAVHLFGSFDAFADKFSRMDSMSAAIVREADEGTYRASTPPAWVHKVNPWVLLKLPDVVVNVFEEILAPHHLAERYQKHVTEYTAIISSPEMRDKELSVFVEELVSRTANLLVHIAVPTYLLAQKADNDLKALFEEEVKEDPSLHTVLERIDHSLPHNITTEMGLELDRLTRLLKDCGLRSVDELSQAVSSGALPATFQEGWQDFLEHYGFRGAGELDIASPRYTDNPHPLLSQMFYGLQSTETESPEEKYDRAQKERRAAYEKLLRVCHAKSRLKAGKLKLLYRIVETFAGYRENHKYYVIRAISILRKRVLEESERLAAQGRLDSVDQVFQLTLEQLCDGLANPAVDLRALAATNDLAIARLRNRNLPAVVDSRGRILTPKSPEPTHGEILGHGVSSGVVQGKVKVLHRVDEKPLLPGEILVTRATDPGWTPLFINAAAIVLEVGGMLQHGALVAREYGKPCVVGIRDAMQILDDGDLVEVDGSLGLVRRLPGDAMSCSE